MQTPYSSRDPLHYESVGDSGAFNKKFIWEKYAKWLGKRKQAGINFLFTTCPDVVADAKETIELHKKHYTDLKEIGFPIAFVVQDGQEDLEIPECDWIFLGGSTEYKLSQTAGDIVTHHARFMPVHIGRVSSVKRAIKFFHLGAISMDGTTLNYGNQAERDWKFRYIDDFLREINQSKKQPFQQVKIF